jgi:hypothetical protein
MVMRLSYVVIFNELNSRHHGSLFFVTLDFYLSPPRTLIIVIPDPDPGSSIEDVNIFRVPCQARNDSGGLLVLPMKEKLFLV